MDPLTIAGLGTGANLLNSALGGFGAMGSSADEARARQAMQNQIINEQKQAYADVAPTYDPYMQAGQQGLQGLSSLNANMRDYDYTPQEFRYEGQVSDFLAPSNDYASQQAQRALDAKFASGGGYMGGGMAKELQKQQFNLGQQGWQQAFNNMNTDSNQKYGRFLDFAKQTQNSMQNSFNNRFGVANQQTGLGQYGTSGNASARMGVAGNIGSAIQSNMGAMGQNAGIQGGTPYAMGMGAINSVFNNDNFQALGQAFPQTQETNFTTSVPSSFTDTLNYQQNPNAGNFGMNASYGKGGYMNTPFVSQGNINIGNQ